MAIYKKSEMVYNDYSWTAVNGDNPKISGEPDNTLLSRREGYEVLYFINKTLEKFGFKQVASGKKLEKMIREHLPSDTRSQKNVYDWLHANWNHY